MSISLIVAILGALLYVVCKYLPGAEHWGELGRLAFLAGLLAFLLK